MAAYALELVLWGDKDTIQETSCNNLRVLITGWTREVEVDMIQNGTEGRARNSEIKSAEPTD